MILSDILTILGIIWAKYFWIVFTNKLKRNNLRHELKKIYVKTSFTTPLSNEGIQTDEDLSILSVL